MKLYSYYADVPELNRFDELKLSVLWRARWNAAGWEPFILGDWQARQHPMFAAFDAAISKLPSVNPPEYEKSCYRRWLALAQVGGGWMSDLDVMPRTDSATIADGVIPDVPTDKLQILQVPCCPALVYCSRENAERLCREFMTGIGRREQEERAHYSDQYALADLIEAKSDWIERRDVVKDYTDVGWESAPILHFPNRIAVLHKMVPRWKHIPAILDGLNP